MGVYQYANGALTPIAGKGKAEYGASTIRRGSFSLSEELNDGDVAIIEVTFDTPMPDADYEVILYADSNYPRSSGGLLVMPWARATQKSESYFTALVYNLTGSTISTGFTTAYTAFKLYTDTEYNNILAAMPSDASASNKLLAKNNVVDTVQNMNMNPVTSNAVADECRLHEAVVNVGDITLNSAGFATTGLYSHLPSGVTSSQVVFCEIANFNGSGYNGDGIGLTNRGAYITGKPNGFIPDLAIRIFYLEHYRN